MSKKLGISTDALTASMKGLASGLAIAASGMVGLSAAFAAADPAGEFEFKLAGIQAILGATSKEMRNLESAALKAGIATQFSPLEAAKGLQILAQAGFDAKGSIEKLNPVLDLAAASLGQLGLQESGGLAVASIKAFGDKLSGTTEAMDLLVRATTRSSLQFRELPLALGIATRGAKPFNASMQDTLIALGEVRNVIPTIERGATAVAVTMERLATPTTKASKEMERLKLKVADAQGKFRPFLDIISELAFKLKDMSQQQRAASLQILFGRRAGAGAIVLLDQITKRAEMAGEGMAGFSKAIALMRGEMAKASITAKSFRDKLLDTFKGQKILLRGTVETIAIAIGKPFTKVLKPVVLGITQSLNFLLRLFLGINPAVKKFFATFFLAASATAVVVGLFLAISALAGLIAGTLATTIGGLLIAFGQFLLMVGLVVGALFALEAAWDNNVAGIKSAFLPIIEKVILAFKGLVALVTKGEITGILADQLSKPENSGLLDFLEGFTRIFAVVKAIAMGIFGAFRDAFDRIAVRSAPVFFQLRKSLSLIGSIFLKLGKIIGKVFGIQMTEDGIDSITTLANVITKVLIEPFVFGLEILIDLFSALIAIINVVLTVVDTIAAPFVSIAEVIGGVFETVFGILTLNFNTLFQGITRIINAVVGMVNATVSALQKVAFAAAPTQAVANSAVQSLEKLKLQQFRPEQVAFAFGADKTAASLRQERLKAEAGPPKRATLKASPTAPPDSTGTNASAVPQSVPASTRGGGSALNRVDTARLIEAAIAAGVVSERGRPIIVEGAVTLDGRRMGTMRAQQERNARARRGAFNPSLRDE